MWLSSQVLMYAPFRQNKKRCINKAWFSKIAEKETMLIPILGLRVNTCPKPHTHMGAVTYIRAE